MPEYHTLHIGAPKPPKDACKTCHGSGYISDPEGWPAPYADKRPPYCLGKGKPFRRCPDCNRGPGRPRKKK